MKVLPPSNERVVFDWSVGGAHPSSFEAAASGTPTSRVVMSGRDFLPRFPPASEAPSKQQLDLHTQHELTRM